jgi:hypothetical protein
MGRCVVTADHDSKSVGNVRVGLNFKYAYRALNGCIRFDRRATSGTMET